jgi:hypothetical protein
MITMHFSFSPAVGRLLHHLPASLIMKLRYAHFSGCTSITNAVGPGTPRPSAPVNTGPMAILWWNQGCCANVSSDSAFPVIPSCHRSATCQQGRRWLPDSHRASSTAWDFKTGRTNFTTQAEIPQLAERSGNRPVQVGQGPKGQHFST